MPGDFVKKIEKRAKEKNGSITIEDSRDNVENGFVLVYGDIEETVRLKLCLMAARQVKRHS